MATNIQLTSIKQLQPIVAPASVQIDFNVLGILPDVVQIYASGVSGDLGSFIEQVEMTPPEISYSDIIELTAGTAWFIHLCPRIKKDNGEFDDQINGQAWEGSCVFAQFTTQAPPGPPPKPKLPTPTINSIEPHQATLRNAGRIDVYWVGSSQFSLYHFMWSELPHGWAEIEVNSGGSSGVWTVEPAIAGRTYSFKVQGCISELIGLDNCSLFSDPTNFAMPTNTHSLREFLRLSNVQLNPGIRSLGQAAYGAGIRAVMHL